MSAPENKFLVQLTEHDLRKIIRDELAAANATNEELLEPEELARRLRVPTSWVYEQSRQGNLPTRRIGRYIRFDLAEVLASQRKDR